MQNLHVVFCVDRAGIVGADGETHHGLFDIGYMSDMPYMSILSPSSFVELGQMLEYAVNTHKGPIAIRYPRGNKEFSVGNFEYGIGKKISDGKDVLIISTGRMVERAMDVSEMLRCDEISATVIVLPTIIPLDRDIILKNISPITVVIEDHCVDCGIGNMISKMFAEENVDSKLLNFGFPKIPIIHGSVDELDKHYGLDKESIFKKIKEEING